MSEQHTPGRILFDPDGVQLFFEAAPLRLLAAMQPDSGPEDAANMRRIAAAWNAILGLTTEDVEGLDVARLMRDRDVLLAACEKAASAAGKDWLEAQLMLAEVVAVVEGDARG